MHTTEKEVEEILDFTSFIKKYFTSFQFDGYNTKLIRSLGLWATRNAKFNDSDNGWHIDRGILLFGPVGVGKDQIMFLLRKYISYLRSSYGFSFKVVWEFAEKFQKNGYACFNEQTGNIYYEELALTEEKTGQPIREFVNHFSAKLLIGAEIINIRHKVFKETAWQTHFTTNLNEDQLMAVYGERCMSRLYEMCNFMSLAGVDRRGRVVPEFQTNKNIPTAPAPRETTVQEHEENRILLENEYRQYCEAGSVTETASLNYNILIIYGCKLSTEEEMRQDMEEMSKTYVAPVVLRGRSAIDQKKEKDNFLWKEARKMAVIKFYQRLKEGGAKTIFDIVDVNVDKLVKPYSAQAK